MLIILEKYFLNSTKVDHRFLFLDFVLVQAGEWTLAYQHYNIEKKMLGIRVCFNITGVLEMKMCIYLEKKSNPIDMVTSWFLIFNNSRKVVLFFSFPSIAYSVISSNVESISWQYNMELFHDVWSVSIYR